MRPATWHGFAAAAAGRASAAISARFSCRTVSMVPSGTFGAFVAPAQRGVLPLMHLQGAKRAGCSLTDRAPALMRCVSRLCGRDLFGGGLGIEGAAAMGGVRMFQTRKQAQKWRSKPGTDLLFTLSPVSAHAAPLRDQD
jgi:hypothetical protein